MLVAGLLAASALGATTTEPECEIGTTYSSCDLAEMPTDPTEALLCRSATEDFRCCVISPTVTPPASFCYASFDDTTYAGIQPCSNDITTTTSYGWSVRCPNPTTTTTTNLEPAAIAAIVVTPVLLIAAAAGVAL